MATGKASTAPLIKVILQFTQLKGCPKLDGPFAF
jgi:hypothetical protein